MATFTNNRIRNTYQRIVQLDSGQLQDGVGNEVTASIAKLDVDHQLTVGDNAVISGSTEILGAVDIVQDLEVGGNAAISGSLTVTGDVVARSFRTTLVSASVVFQSGSTQYGDTLDDTHVFTGSLSVTGSQSLQGESTVTGNIKVLSGAMMNPATNSSDFTVPANYNAGLFGPITNTATITIEDNAQLTII